MTFGAGKISAAFHDNIGTSPNNMTHAWTLTDANGDILFLHVFGEATIEFTYDALTPSISL